VAKKKKPELFATDTPSAHDTDSMPGGAKETGAPRKKRARPDELDDNEFIKHRLAEAKSKGQGHGPMMRGMVKEKPKDMKKTVCRLFAYLGSAKLLVVGLLLMTVLTTLASLAGPALQGIAIDAIRHKNPDGTYSFEWERLVFSLTAMGAVYLISSLFTYFSGIWSAKLSQNTVYRMRSDLFTRISYLPIKYTDTHRHGDLMSRMTNDVDNISNAISGSISSLFSGVITLIGSLAMMLYYSPVMTLAAIVVIPLTLISTSKLSNFMRKYFVKQQRALGSLNSHIEEIVTGFKTVVAYEREKQATEEFEQYSDELRRVGVTASVFGGLMGPLMNVIGNIGFLLIAVTGGWLAIKGVITIGVIQAFIQYSKQFTRPLTELANQYTGIITAVAGAERVFEIMDAPGERDEGGEPLDISSVRGDLSLEHVDFSYKPHEPVLSDFNLEVKAGQKIAIVGRTGSGKTTIVNLLTRFYDTDTGAIKLDGRDIRNIKKSDLRSAIAIVLQDTVLFSDTIGENIRFGRLSATDDEVRRAAITAEADPFIERLPQQYDTPLTESGGNLSQGQRQLLSIARAVLADPKILILDEATSSVDTRTEMQIQQAMIKLMEGRTSLIIAHRLSTIRDADKIIVLADGHIVESGNHEELLAAKGVYYDLYRTQFAGIET
jgi:ATP-binding cassette subfamily B multidrug efflux pump